MFPYYVVMPLGNAIMTLQPGIPYCGRVGKSFKNSVHFIKIFTLTKRLGHGVCLIFLHYGVIDFIHRKIMLYWHNEREGLLISKYSLKCWQTFKCMMLEWDDYPNSVVARTALIWKYSWYYTYWWRSGESCLMDIHEMEDKYITLLVKESWRQAISWFVFI